MTITTGKVCINMGTTPGISWGRTPNTGISKERTASKNAYARPKASMAPPIATAKPSDRRFRTTVNLMPPVGGASQMMSRA
ncbi:hypothetical protein D3C80_2126520 [compost metagenome]